MYGILLVLYPAQNQANHDAWNNNNNLPFTDVVVLDPGKKPGEEKQQFQLVCGRTKLCLSHRGRVRYPDESV